MRVIVKVRCHVNGATRDPGEVLDIEDHLYSESVYDKVTDPAPAEADGKDSEHTA